MPATSALFVCMCMCLCVYVSVCVSVCVCVCVGGGGQEGVLLRGHVGGCNCQIHSSQKVRERLTI